MAEPRFFVSGITGYTVSAAGRGERSGRVQRTTWWVGDRVYCHREVAVFAPGGGFRIGDAARQAQARALCDRLNAEHPTGGDS